MVEFSKGVYVAIFMYCTICTFKDLFVQTSAEKKIPITKVGLSANTGPTLKFLYCYSCGYRKLFDDYSVLIQNKYQDRDISIQGSNYDPPGLQSFIAKLLKFGKIFVIIMIVLGFNIFAHLGREIPSWWTWCSENKIYSCIMIFFMCNAIEGHLISTGAFEIMLDDMPVWSKLETGRIPQPPELFQIIDRHMLFDDVGLKSKFPK